MHIDNRSPLIEGAFLVYPHPRTRVGVGYFQGCRPVTPVSNPLRFLETKSEISSNFSKN
jgi:hypothetical protein